jgi:hypothetical protein
MRRVAVLVGLMSLVLLPDAPTHAAAAEPHATASSSCTRQTARIRKSTCPVDIPTAEFTWSVSQIETRDHGTDVTNKNFDTSKTGLLTLDGCGSDSGDPRHPRLGYSWTLIDDQGRVSHPPPHGCRAYATRPLDDHWLTWMVSLRVRRRDGATSRTSQHVRFRDLLIASLGDSAASGEGNPDVPSSYGPLGLLAHLASWNDKRCDRSGRAATARLAEKIEQANPGTSVTFWGLACSGAAITDNTSTTRLTDPALSVCTGPVLATCVLTASVDPPVPLSYGSGQHVVLSGGGLTQSATLDQPAAVGATTIRVKYHGVMPNTFPVPTTVTFDDYGNGGLLTPYDGENKPSGRLCDPIAGGACNHRALPPQVDQLGELLRQAGRPLDALFLTAGANDVAWSQLVKDCYALFSTDTSCINKSGPAIVARLQHNPDDTAGFLPDRFTELAQHLKNLGVVLPDRTFLTDYWDATADKPDGTQRQDCGFGQIVRPPTAATRAWGQAKVIQPMNQIIRNQASRFRWNLVGQKDGVGGIERAFYGHGMCAPLGRSWIVSLRDSDHNQGHGLGIIDLGLHPEDINGSWHANAAGLAAITEVLYRALLPVLQSDGLPPAGPLGYAPCAAEGGTCAFSGSTDVAYGANGTYTYAYGVGGTSVSCSNSTFGDPAPNVSKACFTVLGPDSRWTYCATEGGTCSPPPTMEPAEIAFGVANGWYYKYLPSGSIGCNAAEFGGDPYPNVHKACFWYPEVFH